MGEAVKARINRALVSLFDIVTFPIFVEVAANYMYFSYGHWAATSSIFESVLLRTAFLLEKTELNSTSLVFGGSKENLIFPPQVVRVRMR